MPWRQQALANHPTLQQEWKECTHSPSLHWLGGFGLSGTTMATFGKSLLVVALTSLLSALPRPLWHLFSLHLYALSGPCSHNFIVLSLTSQAFPGLRGLVPLAIFPAHLERGPAVSITATSALAIATSVYRGLPKEVIEVLWLPERKLIAALVWWHS